MPEDKRPAAALKPLAAGVSKPPIFPRAAAYSDEKRLEDHGFPSEVSKAFLLTADETDCVVMSRAPGGAGTELIRAGYDLKGFLIKAKSCNWGPMAGFLCQIPALNKYGAKKIGYNYGNHKKYLEYRKKKGILKTQAYIPLRITAARKATVLKSTAGADKTGFLQTGFWKEVDGKVAGLAFVRSTDEKIDRSVVVEFLMEESREAQGEKKPELWSLYHGNIFYRPTKDGPYLDLLEKSAEPADIDDEKDRRKMPAMRLAPREAGGDSSGREIRHDYVVDVIEWQSEQLKGAYAKTDAVHAELYQGWLTKIGIKKRPARTHFYPICGAQNPYPPYHQARDRNPTKTDRIYTSGSEDEYKNAATGDYDLFAVWPVKPRVSRQMLLRTTESIEWQGLMRAADATKRAPAAAKKEKAEEGEKDAAAVKKKRVEQLGFFVESAEKPGSLVARASPNVFVEIIPGFDEIGEFESEELGNIHQLTFLVTQTLNSLVSIAAEKAGGQGAGRVAPNMSFHSDEGGRPGIDEVDYPFAVYLPRSLFEWLKRDLENRKLKPEVRESLDPVTRMLLIDRHDDFVDLACMLRERCWVLFNHIWLMQMLSLDDAKLKKETADKKIVVEGEDDAEAVKKKRVDYLQERRDEAAKIDSKVLRRMRAGLADLFLGSYWKPKATGNDELAQEIAEALGPLMDAFLEIAAKDFEGETKKWFQHPLSIEQVLEIPGTMASMKEKLLQATIPVPATGEADRS